jgi:hypothetical protein
MTDPRALHDDEGSSNRTHRPVVDAKSMDAGAFVAKTPAPGPVDPKHLPELRILPLSARPAQRDIDQGPEPWSGVLHYSPEDQELDAEVTGKVLCFLLRGVVHKLNNVLSVFSNMTQIMELRGAGSSAMQSRRDLAALNGSVRSGTSVVQLLGLLVPNRSQQEALESICVGPLLQDLAHALLCENRGLRFPVLVESEPQIYLRSSRRALICATLLALEAMLETCAPSYCGRLLLRGELLQGRPAVRIRFELPQDHLPFSVPTPQLDPSLQRYCSLHGLEARRGEGSGGFVLLAKR